MKARWHRILFGGTTMLLLVLAVAALSDSPRWRSLPENVALVRLSFTHGGDRSASCRERTPEELAALPPNMRRKEVCERRRPSVYVELEVDGTLVFAKDLPPRGIAGSGPSQVYERLLLPAGVHDIAVRLRDRPGTEGFDYAARTRATLAPAQSFVIDFRSEAGGFVFK